MLFKIIHAQSIKLLIQFDCSLVDTLTATGQQWLWLRMDLLPDTQNRGLRMRRESRERYLRHRLQRISLVSDPGMHHGTCVTHVPWCMSVSLSRGGGENVSGIPRARATRNFAYLVRGSLATLKLIKPDNSRDDNGWYAPFHYCFHYFEFVIGNKVISFRDRSNNFQVQK